MPHKPRFTPPGYYLHLTQRGNYGQPTFYADLARPTEPNSIRRFMQALNGQYATCLHGRLVRTGRLWQGPYYACILQHTHLLTALRARMVDDATAYPWSSAQAHIHNTPNWLDTETFTRLVTPSDWPQLLNSPQTKKEAATLRRATFLEKPFGTPDFAHAIEFEHPLPTPLSPSCTI